MNDLTFADVLKVGLVVFLCIVCYDAIKSLRNLRIKSKDERREALRRLHEEPTIKDFEPEWRKTKRS